MDRVVIEKGHLVIGKRHFLLESIDVEVCNFHYAGPAFLEGNQMRIVIGRSTIYDFEVGNATQESLDYEEGYERGLKQKQLYVPKHCSTSFYYGLLDAHTAKKEDRNG